MPIKNITFMLATLVLLSGCMRVVSNVTSFSNLTVPATGQSVAVVGYPEETNSSLEFKSYRHKFEEKLRLNGFAIAPEDTADYIAFVSYGIDTGTEQTGLISTPVYGQTAGGTTYSSGTVSSYSGGYGSYSGTSYTMPTYGIVGSSTSSYNYTTYKRNLAIDIVEASSVDSGEPVKLFEGRLISSGSCGVIKEVIDEFIEAIFTDFPNANGQITIPAEYNC